jgi:hypothetical protein
MTKLGDYVLSGQEINSNVVKSIDEVGSEGGGGSSDFSTAEVTIINNAPEVNADMGAPCLLPDRNVSGTLNIGETNDTYDVILYNDGCYLSMGDADPGNTYTPSGNAEIITTQPFGIKMLHITGDCTITITHD